MLKDGILQMLVDYRSSGETPLDAENLTRLNEVKSEEDIADEIQAKLASIKGMRRNMQRSDRMLLRALCLFRQHSECLCFYP